MEHGFWHDRWQSGRIGFHENRPNPLLLAHFAALSVPANGRVFVPLCGKTLDIGWLMSRGHRVAGAELSELAIGQLFKELGLEPEISDLGDLKSYSAENIDIFVGDVFDLTPDLLGPIDAVFDRAALVALHAEMRAAYAPHIAALAGNAPQLLITFDYDQSRLDGPPFSVTSDEVRLRYGDGYELSELATNALAGGMKGVPAKEIVWLLRPL
ncbi:thiopurine S-methyltransferase [Hoeflea marina]|uniref:Thiopurine S-methyltransferase n=1 Tax=Hoeflea marina TaxID=274592 RepID=A0A317PQX2_9HYPH|nr:thiopurine S-methyltransferase [Hoeflea marina]PWW03872.1 thiopurine S-methyltransferase [Hoeflea marina]